MSKDYYKSLGIERGASKEEIKKAFHRLAHKYHPDKKGGDEARFKEINEAYQVLSDDRKRAEYDSYGRTFNGGNAGPEGFGGFDPSGFQNMDFGNLNDIFSEFFGGGYGDEGGLRRGRDMSIELAISFKEATFGTERKVLVNKTTTCRTCSGSGGKPGTAQKKCPTCNGNGKIHETRRSFFGTFSSVHACGNCHGSGTVPAEACAVCKGRGVLRGQEEVTIKVPAGLKNGEIIRLAEMGEAVPRAPSGDLYVKIGVIPDPVFKRDGNNLLMNLNIKLSDAMLGGEYTVKTLDGDIAVKIPEGVSPNEVLRVKGKGVPMGKGVRGDLLIKIEVTLPTRLTKRVRDLIEQLRKEGI
ncbi:molecular chaperone DnaJ [Candidatus Parcubacteria bacterium]|nr:molecular chaperone DnaJ [Candidatus Parcubacteria bacterium]